MASCLFVFIFSPSWANANYCEQDSFNPNQCLYQKLLDKGVFNKMVPSGYSIDTSKGFNGFEISTNYSASDVHLNDTVQTPALISDSSVVAYGCYKNNSLKIQGTSSIELEQYQSTSEAQSVDTSFDVSTEITTDTQLGTTNLKTDTNISYSLDTSQSNTKTDSSSTTTKNEIKVSESLTVSCGIDKGNTNYVGPHYFVYSQSADQITIQDADSGSPNVNANYDIQPDSNTDFTLHTYKNISSRDNSSLSVFLKTKNGNQCSFGVGPGTMDYQAYASNSCQNQDINWKNVRQFYLSTARGGWDQGNNFNGMVETKNGWAELNFQKNGWEALPLVNGNFKSFRFWNNSYYGSTDYKAVTAKLDDYLDYNFGDDVKNTDVLSYDDEKNSQTHRVNFIYNAKSYMGLQSSATQVPYFLFEPDRPNYSLSNIYQNCNQVVKIWNENCPNNTIQDIAITQNYPEDVKKEINKFIEQYDEEQTPLDTN